MTDGISNNGAGNTAPANQQEGAGSGSATNASIENFEAWLAGQDEQVQTAYSTHIAGLKNTVKATREERDGLKKQVESALKEAEKGSQLERTLTDTLSKLESAERKATFLEDATRPEIGCRNPRAAFALAVSEGLFLRGGSPDWAAIRAAAPELFGQNNTKSGAGNGTSEPPKGTDMNTIIRRAAGL